LKPRWFQGFSLSIFERVKIESVNKSEFFLFFVFAPHQSASMAAARSLWC